MNQIKVDGKYEILGKRVVVTNITKTRVIYRIVGTGKKHYCSKGLFLLRCFGDRQNG